MVRTPGPTVGAAQPAGPFGSAIKGYKDYNVAFAQSLILKTPPPLRATRKGPGTTALEQCVREVTVPPRALPTLRLRSDLRPEGGRLLPGASSPWKGSLPLPSSSLLPPPGGRTNLAN